MKLPFGLLLILITVVSSEKFVLRTPEDAAQAHATCRQNYNIPDDIYEHFLNYDFPEHRRTKCYMQCFVEKMGLFTVRRGFSETNIITQFTHGNTKDLGTVQHGLEKCIDHNEWESDNCTWVHRVFSCWLKINRPVVRKTYGAN